MPGGAGASGNPRQGKAALKTGHPEYLARAVRGYLRVRALPRAQRHDGPEILSQRLEGRAARKVPRPARPARQELEVLDGRCHRARAVEQISGGLSGNGPAHLEPRGALVRGAGRPQMVRAGGDRLRHRQCARRARSEIPESRSRLAGRIQAGPQGAGERGQEAGGGEEGGGEGWSKVVGGAVPSTPSYSAKAEYPVRRDLPVNHG